MFANLLWFDQNEKHELYSSSISNEVINKTSVVSVGLQFNDL